MFARQRKQQTTVLYHGVSAMAMKGLVAMGDSGIGGNNDQSFSQLPTQSVLSPSSPSSPPQLRLPHVHVGWAVLVIGRIFDSCGLRMSRYDLMVNRG